MKFYLVFGSKKRPADLIGGKKLDWGQPPVGIYYADDPDDACLAAAKEVGEMGTYFAVEGSPWGLDMVENPATVLLGHDDGPSARMARVLDRMEETDRKIRELEQEKQSHPQLGKGRVYDE